MGEMIYVLYRPLNLRMFYPFKKTGTLHIIENVRNAGLFPDKDSVPEWIMYNLPDGLWLLAYLMFMEVIWIDSNPVTKSLFVWGMPVVIITSEVLQYWSVIEGTWDVGDVISYLCACVTYLIIKKQTKL